MTAVNHEGDVCDTSRRSRMFLLIENYPESKTREIFYQQNMSETEKKLSEIIHCVGDSFQSTMLIEQDNGESLQLVMFARYRICPKLLQHVSKYILYQISLLN
ncbi:hypothetical protein NQ317_019139 [Molorchus minor]|uniref:Uncharacterized protein n=1 Tax=Molorchus minor TaxID=1323400 RepID=A0ABQ9J2U2_9CUCU|nr:hypothetical protein NQ317_019139 [Molorchus minor]